MHCIYCSYENHACAIYKGSFKQSLKVNSRVFQLFINILFLSISSFAQTNAGSPEVYFAFGTNTSFYSKSDIRLQSHDKASLDVKIHDVRGRDDRGLSFKGGAPQYNIQVGIYYPTKKFGIEFGFDRIKYFVRQNQQVKIEGMVDGAYFDMNTNLTPQLLQLEHSDGANYAIFKLVKRLSLTNKRNTNQLNMLIKAGGGPVIPKTSSIVLGKHRDDRYHIAGYVVAVETGLLFQFSKHLLAEWNVKAAYANYRRFLIADGYGSQQWNALHTAVLLGYKL